MFSLVEKFVLKGTRQAVPMGKLRDELSVARKCSDRALEVLGTEMKQVATVLMRCPDQHIQIGS